jgi:uncharacterized membrane protein YhdT
MAATTNEHKALPAWFAFSCMALGLWGMLVSLEINHPRDRTPFACMLAENP